MQYNNFVLIVLTHGLLEETDVPNHGKKMKRLKFYLDITFEKNGRLTYFFANERTFIRLNIESKYFQLMTGNCPNLAIPKLWPTIPQSGLIGCIFNNKKTKPHR